MGKKFLILLLLASGCCWSHGTIMMASLSAPNCIQKTLSLYRYDSAFHREFIATQNTINGVTIFQRPDSEIDAYLLEDVATKFSLLFFWDGNITIDINCGKIFESIVHNSPETAEFRKTERMKYELGIAPLKTIDSLILECRNKNKINTEETCKVLVQKRNQIAIESRNVFDIFILDYVKNNPESFTSLYYLTMGGDAMLPEKTYQNAFKGISDILKHHRRSKLYNTF